MPDLSVAPKLQSFEVLADEATPGKFILKMKYRAWYNQTVVDLVVVKDQISEADTVDPDFWSDFYGNEVSNAYAAIGYTIAE